MSVTGWLKCLTAGRYPTVPPARAQELVRQRRAVLLDVREEHEWRAGHAHGARHVPLGVLSARLGELPDDRPVVTMCAHGMRSARAARLLSRAGREVYNLRGGMHAWTAAGLPTTTRRRR